MVKVFYIISVVALDVTGVPSYQRNKKLYLTSTEFGLSFENNFYDAEQFESKEEAKKFLINNKVKDLLMSNNEIDRNRLSNSTVKPLLFREWI